jgi:hypothetical protein
MTDPHPAREPYWPAGQDATFKQALEAGGGLLGRCAAAIPSLPLDNRPYPGLQSFSEALAIYHAREEEKRKLLGKQTKAKQRATQSWETGYPGAVQGGGDQSAFWMYVEVSRVPGDQVRSKVCGHCGSGPQIANRVRPAASGAAGAGAAGIVAGFDCWGFASRLPQLCLHRKLVT